MSNLDVRISTEADFEEIFQIWLENQQQATGRILSQTESSTFKAEFLRLFFHVPHAIFYVAESASKELVGWQALLPLLSNPILGKYTAQSSTYVKKTFFKHDAGGRLFEYAITDAKRLGIDHVYAWVKTDNAAANKIAGRFNGYKFLIPGTVGNLPDFNLYVIPSISR